MARQPDPKVQAQEELGSLISSVIRTKRVVSENEEVVKRDILDAQAELRDFLLSEIAATDAAKQAIKRIDIQTEQGREELRTIEEAVDDCLVMTIPGKRGALNKLRVEVTLKMNSRLTEILVQINSIPPDQRLAAYSMAMDLNAAYEKALKVIKKIDGFSKEAVDINRNQLVLNRAMKRSIQVLSVGNVDVAESKARLVGSVSRNIHRLIRDSENPERREIIQDTQGALQKLVQSDTVLGLVYSELLQLVIIPTNGNNIMETISDALPIIMSTKDEQYEVFLQDLRTVMTYVLEKSLQAQIDGPNAKSAADVLGSFEGKEVEGALDLAIQASTSVPNTAAIATKSKARLLQRAMKTERDHLIRIAGIRGQTAEFFRNIHETASRVILNVGSSNTDLQGDILHLQLYIQGKDRMGQQRISVPLKRRKDGQIYNPREALDNIVCDALISAAEKGTEEQRIAATEALGYVAQRHMPRKQKARETVEAVKKEAGAEVTKHGTLLGVANKASNRFQTQGKGFQMAGMHGMSLGVRAPPPAPGQKLKPPKARTN